jgi:HupE / UreJ protein
MSASMPCSEYRGRWFGRWLAACALLLWALAPAAWAHKSSDAYLKLAPEGSGTSLRVDLALRDLDAAIDLDADADGRLTWGEVKAAWPAIDAYVQARVKLDGCVFDHPAPALERRADGVYAVLAYRSACAFSAGAGLRYSVLADVDPTHRGLASIVLDGAAPVLRVLDPGAGSAAPAAPGTPLRTAAPELNAPAAPEVSSALQFVREGVHHILTGYDHVLFLMCLLLPSVMRRTPQGWAPVSRIGEALWPIIGIVTAFTLAHSITLALASLKWVSLPSWFIEPAIAVTIVLAAVDNLWPIFRGRRALVTFLFGLIHGFGFAGVLAEMDLPPAHFAWALFQFNVGLELGQIAIVLVATGVLFAVRRGNAYSAMVIRGGSYAAIVVGVLWFLERTADLSLLPL